MKYGEIEFFSDPFPNYPLAPIPHVKILPLVERIIVCFDPQLT